MVQTSSDATRDPTPTVTPVYSPPTNETNTANGNGNLNGSSEKKPRKLSKKNKRRLYVIIPLAVVTLVLFILWEHYKTSIENWFQPASNWLDEREKWSWVIPVVILVVLSFPPLFGHEIVLLIAGLAYPIGVAIGIACAGAILGEALVFLVFKYAASGYVLRKRARLVQWEAIARVVQEAGFKGVVVIRYSIIPPHLVNPLFATTGMSFWLYMVSVVISLPKQIVFVALGNPDKEHTTGAKVGKVIAVGVLCVISLWASRYIRRAIAVKKAEVEAERGVIRNEDGEIVFDPVKEQYEAEKRGANAPAGAPSNAV